MNVTDETTQLIEMGVEVAADAGDDLADELHVVLAEHGLKNVLAALESAANGARDVHEGKVSTEVICALRLFESAIAKAKGVVS